MPRLVALLLSNGRDFYSRVLSYYYILFIVTGFLWLPSGSLIITSSTTSPQHQYDYEDPVVVAPVPQVYIPNLPQSQIDALYALYTSTNGDRWIWLDRSEADDDSQNSFSIPWNFTNNANPCLQHWQGIICNKNCTISPKPTPYIYCTILELNLDSHNLNGNLPIELTNLTSLTSLSLADNRLKHPLPENLLLNMTTLVSLDLSGNLFLGGWIPDNFSKLINLQIIDLSSSHFSGSLPSSLFTLPKLLYLDVGDNYLTGSIISNLCRLPFVEYIVLELNAFTGTISPCIGRMEAIKVLMLGNNLLSQSIPNTLSTLKNINTLDLSYNYFDGTIPHVISTMTSLVTLRLNGNLLTGTVPSLLPLSNLTWFLVCVNELEGLAPNISATTALGLYEININQFTGRMVSLNSTNLIAVGVESNYLTGTIPFLINGSRSIVSPAMLEFASEMDPIVDSKGFFQHIATINITTNALFYVNFSQNLFTGPIPDWVFTSPFLSYVYMYDNLLSGTIPDIPTNITWIGVLYLDKNLLTGTIPQTILRQQYLVNLRLADNKLTGTVPSTIFNSETLIEIALENNRFSGPLPTLPMISFNVTADNKTKPYSNLKILTLSNNEFTGELDTTYFTSLPSLQVFAASSNCLTGRIPEAICEAKLLRQLILDGMASATFCRSFIFPALQSVASRDSLTSGWFNSFVLKHGMKGSIPSCLYEMPVLQSLYLSGNELVGSIPNALNISKTLINLRLSYNRLTGSIPNIIQHRSWSVLDLSFNKISGHLVNGFNPASQQSNGNSNSSGSNIVRNDMMEQKIEPWNARMPLLSANEQAVAINNTSTDHSSLSVKRMLYLDVNRLSGTLPDSVQTIDEISILNGNIFYCDFSRKQLPNHDPHYHSYSCGSNSINQAFFGLLIAFCGFVSFLVWLKYHSYKYGKTLYNDYLVTLLRDIRLYNRAFELAESTSSLTCSPSVVSLTITTTPPTGSQTMNDDAEVNPIHQQGTAPLGVTRSAYVQNEMRSVPVSKMSLVLAWRFFHELRRYCCVIAFVLMLLLMPTFRTLNVFQSGFKTKYAWEFSPIFVSGYESGIILLVTFATVIAMIYYCLDMKLHHLVVPKDSYRMEVIEGSKRTHHGNTTSIRTQRVNSFRFLRGSSTYRGSLVSRSLIPAVHSSHMTDNVKANSMVKLHSDNNGKYYEMSDSTTAGCNPGECDSGLPIQAESNITTEDKQAKSCFSFFLNFKSAQILILVLVGFVNTISMALINVAYVIIVVYVRNQTFIILAQLSLAIIKVWWNDVFLWQLLRFTKRVIHRLWIQKREVNDNNLLVEEMVSCILPADIFLIVCALLFNNVIAPCLSIAVVSPSCFYNSFVAANSLSSTYRYCSTYILVGRNRGACFTTIQGTTTVSPPFIYSYQCASLLPVNYTGVYVYMALMSGFIMPAIKLVMQHIHGRTLTSKTRFGMVLHKLINQNLSPLLIPLQEHPYLLFESEMQKFESTNEVTDKSLVRDILMNDFLPKNDEVFALKLRAMRPIFDKNRLVVRVIGFLTLMTSFGVVFPPLAVVICISICSLTYFEQLSIGRVLYQSEKLGYHWYRQKLSYDLEGIVDIFVPAILPMTFVASLLFACLIFDTFGDRYGYRVAIIPTVVMVLVPGCIWLYVRIDWQMIYNYLIGKQPNDADRTQPDEISVELVETNTSHST